jgi:hypothetical protein
MAATLHSSKRFETYGDFITDDERLELSRAVNEMRNDWVPNIPPGEDEERIQKLAQAGFGFYTLGDAVYVMAKNKQSPDVVSPELRQAMLDNFGWLYDRLLNKIDEITGIPSNLHPLTVPGFQISTVPFDFVMPYYHVDNSILWYDERAKFENIYSLVTVVDMSPSCGYLEYLDENEQGIVWTKRLNYQYNVLHTWSGTVPHRIGNFKVAEGHQRLTFQAHMFYDPEENCNWVYF